MSNIGEGLSVVTHPRQTDKPIENIKTYSKTSIVFSFREKKRYGIIVPYLLV